MTMQVYSEANVMKMMIYVKGGITCTETLTLGMRMNKAKE